MKIENFEQKIKYKFSNKEFLKQALTHSSAIGKRERSTAKSNERMEFLGDSVLSVVVSKHLYDKLKSFPEGRLTKLRAKLVCEDALYNNAKSIGLGEMIVLGKGEEQSGGRDRKSILSDAFEAVIAAIYLDGGLESASAFILPFLPTEEQLKSDNLITGDYKTALQETVQKNPQSTIVYQESGEEGLSHNKNFYSTVVINEEVAGSGSGKTKKEAQQMAAKNALIKLGVIK